MKIRVSQIALVCMVPGLIFTSQSTADIDSATITGMWLFDEGSGKVAKDSSGNGLDADLIDGPEWVDGVFGKALEFDGAASHVKIPDHQNPSEAITVSIWAKSNAGTWNQHGWVFEKRDAYMLHNVQGNTTMSWIVCNGGCWNLPFTWETGQVGPKDITEWHMYTGTFDSKTGDWKLYIDGKEESTLELTKSPVVVDNGPIFIGNDT